MTDSDSDFALTLRSYLRQSPADGHPPSEDLVAYRAGSLEPDPEAEVRTHLVECEDCRELLLELAALESQGPADGASEIETAAAWKVQRRRLSPGPRPSPARFGGWIAAAALLAVVGVLSVELRELRRVVAAWGDPELPRVVARERGARGGAEDLPLLMLRPESPGLVLLPSASRLPYRSFRAEFFSPDDRALLAREGLSAEADLLLVQVTRELLPEGAIRVVVSGWTGDRYETIEEYGFRVQHP